MRYKKGIAVILAATVLLSAGGCGKAPTSGALSRDWIDSDLFENVEATAGVSLKDDYAAAVNHEWALSQEKTYGYPNGGLPEAAKNLDEAKRALLDDPSISGKNIELLRTADGLYCDWEYRNSLGVEPLKEYLGYIDEIHSLEDLTGYMIDNEKNPFALSLLDLETGNNDALEDSLALFIGMPEFTLDSTFSYFTLDEEGQKTKAKEEERVNYILGRLGYSKQDCKELLAGCFRFESNLTALDPMLDFERKTVISRKEVLERAGSYPLETMLDHYSIRECDSFCGSLTYLDGLKKVYTEENLEDMKAFFKVRLSLKAMKYLDLEAFDHFRVSGVDRTDANDKAKERTTDFQFFREIKDTPLTAAMDQVFIDRYYDEATDREASDFIHKVKDKYRTMVRESDRISEESKEKIIDKLDKIKEHVMVPDNTPDFTGVELISKEEGGTFLDALGVLNKLRYEHMGEMTRIKCDRAFWDIYNGDLSTTQPNAIYYRPQNAMYIYMGILTAPVCEKTDRYEEKLGSYVVIAAHEVSHAFDSGGIYYDAEGRQNLLIPEEDAKLWEEADARIMEHFSNCEPFEGSGCYGDNDTICVEVIADIEGLQVCLMIAGDSESFDYDLFFKSFSRVWRTLTEKSEELPQIREDSHLVGYLRINYDLMQFDEFQKTYDVKPGDGMYLEPDQRVRVF